MFHNIDSDVDRKKGFAYVALGIVTLGLSIFGMYVGISSDDDCSNNIGSLNLSNALTVFASILFIPWSFVLFKVGWNNIFQKYGPKIHGEIITCYLCLMIVWVIIFAIILLTSTCRKDNPLLYATSLVLFIYVFVGGVTSEVVYQYFK